MKIVAFPKNNLLAVNCEYLEGKKCTAKEFATRAGGEIRKSPLPAGRCSDCSLLGGKECIFRITNLKFKQ